MQINTKKRPIVSIIMAAYNAEKYIVEAIESVLFQTYSNWELIITDDFSNDETSKIIDEYKKKDNRIKSIRLDKNSGQAIARNKAIEKSLGKYLAILDADDIALPNRLITQVEFLESNKDIDFVGSYVELIDEKGEIIGKKKKPLTYEEIKFPLLLQTQFVMSAVILRKKVLIEIGGFDNDYLYAEDYDMWDRLLARGKKCANIPAIFTQHRIQPQSVTQMSHTQPVQEKHALDINARCVARFINIPKNELENLVNFVNNKPLSVFQLFNALKWYKCLVQKYIASDTCADAEAIYVKNLYKIILKHSIKIKIKQLLRIKS
ncbi:MAG: glycosyltransferase [Patescibacteria group bacterium]